MVIAPKKWVSRDVSQQAYRQSRSSSQVQIYCIYWIVAQMHFRTFRGGEGLLFGQRVQSFEVKLEKHDHRYNDRTEHKRNPPLEIRTGVG
jgi:hypothetical protein